MITQRPIARAVYLGDAFSLTDERWLALNCIHLRERWRLLIDNCCALGIELPDERDYDAYCLSQLDVEREKRRRSEDLMQTLVDVARAGMMS